MAVTDHEPDRLAPLPRQRHSASAGFGWWRRAVAPTPLRGALSKSKRARTRKTGSASKVRSRAGGRKIVGHHSARANSKQARVLELLRRASRGMIQLAWRFLMFQKDSALAEWYRQRTANAPSARKRWSWRWRGYADDMKDRMAERAPASLDHSGLEPGFRRWEVRTARSQQAFDRAVAFEPRIPARELRMPATSTERADAAIQNIRPRRFRCAGQALAYEWRAARPVVFPRSCQEQEKVDGKRDEAADADAAIEAAVKEFEVKDPKWLIAVRRA
jgi:hypothetical protein